MLAIHYLGHMIEEYFGDGSRWKIRIDYLREDSPLGTAGAIGLLNPRSGVPFLSSNGDVSPISAMVNYSISTLVMAPTATMAVRVHEWQHPFGVVHTKGVDIVGFEEKPVARSHINAGIYVLEPAALDALGDRDRCDMPALFERLQQRSLRTIVYPMHEPWLDVGHPDDYRNAQGRGPGESN